VAALRGGGGGRGQVTCARPLINGCPGASGPRPTAPSTDAATAARAPGCVAAWRAAARAWRGGAASARRGGRGLRPSGWPRPCGAWRRAVPRALADACAAPRRLPARPEGVVRARRCRNSRRRSLPAARPACSSGVGSLSAHRAPQPPAGAAPARWAHWAAARALTRRRRAGTAPPAGLSQALCCPLLRNGRRARQPAFRPALARARLTRPPPARRARQRHNAAASVCAQVRSIPCVARPG
jgi:hypothetical protein